MNLSVKIGNQTYKIDSKNPIDISIPLKFNGEQPNAYGVEKAISKPCEAGELVGDTRQGGSCNFEQYTFIPHCNGTHTECVGHITNKRISVRDSLQDAFVLAELISIEAVKALKSSESYAVDLKKEDLLITKSKIKSSLEIPKLKSQNLFPKALIIRTLPNRKKKQTQEYGDYIPPFFSSEAIDYIVELGFKHLLVDLPSIDRLFDDGKLSNHRKFWNIDQGKFEINERSRINSTITELIYVPNKIKEGQYLLNIQVAPFESDTSPSRPLIFKIL